MSLLKLDSFYDPSKVIHDNTPTHKGVGAEVEGDKKAYRRVIDYAYNEKTMRVVEVVSWVFK